MKDTDFFFQHHRPWSIVQTEGGTTKAVDRENNDLPSVFLLGYIRFLEKDIQLLIERINTDRKQTQKLSARLEKWQKKAKAASARAVRYAREED